MTARTVVGTVDFPIGSGVACVGARVQAELYAGPGVGPVYGTVSDDIAVGATAALTANDGSWSLELEPNVAIAPAETVYRVVIQPPDRAPTEGYIEVPDTVGPHEFTDLLVDAPASATSSALARHIDDTSTHGVAGQVVGTTDTQTLSNKTLTLPIINGGILDGVHGALAGVQIVSFAADADVGAVINSYLALGPVLAPPGSFDIATTIRVGDYDWLHGAGPGRTTFTAAASLSLDAPVIVNADTLNGNIGIELADFTVNGNRTARPTCTAANIQIAVSLLNGGTGHVEDVELRNIESCESASIGIVLGRSWRGTVTGCHSHHNTRDGITHYYDCFGCIVTKNWVNDVGDDLLGFNAENINAVTTGSIGSGSQTLNVINAAAFHVGDGIYIAGAGAASADLYTTITGITDTAITLAIAAGTTVVAAVVRVGTVGHPMRRMVIADNVLGPNAPDATSGSCISLAGVQDSVIHDNICYGGWATGILVANWNTTEAKNLDIHDNDIIAAGLSHPSTDGNGILVAGARSVSSTSGRAGCSNIRIHHNRIDDSKYMGIRVLSQSGGEVTELDIERNTITNSGTQAVPAAAMSITGGVRTSRIAGNRCYDDQTPKTQSYGLVMDSPVGDLVLTENDFNGNLTGRTNLTNMTGLTRLVLRDNDGFTPHKGISTVAGAWSTLTIGAATLYYKDLAVSFGLAFPSAPIVFVSTPHSGLGASAVNVTGTGFTLRLWAYGDPGTGNHFGNWVAESPA